MSEKKKPHETIKLGRIEVAIWRNETENGVRFNLTSPRRNYKKDEKSKWQSTDSLGRDDALTAAKVLELAVVRVYELEVEHRQKAQQQKRSVRSRGQRAGPTQRCPDHDEVHAHLAGRPGQSSACSPGTKLSGYCQEIDRPKESGRVVV